MADIIKSAILDIKLDQGQAIQDAAALRDRLAELNEQLKSNKRLTEEDKAAYEVLKGTIKSVTQELTANTQQLANQNTAVKANNGSFNQLQASLKVGEAQLKALTGTIQKNADGTFALTKEYFDAKKEVDAAKNALLLFNAGIAQGNLNVGNYDNTLSGMRQKLADLQIVIQNTNVEDLNFEKASIDAQELSTKIQILEGKIDSAGQKIAKNTIKDGFNNAMGAAQAFTGALGLLSLAMGSDSQAGENLRKVLIGVTIAQTALTIAQQKKDIVDTISLIKTKAQTAANWLYTISMKAATAATETLKGALVATGIGAVIVGLGFLVDKLGIFKKRTDEATDSQKEFNKEIEVARSNQFAAADKLIAQADENASIAIQQIQLEKERLEATGASSKEILEKEYAINNLRQRALLDITKEMEALDKADSKWREINIAKYKLETEQIKIVNDLKKETAIKEVADQINVIEKNKEAISKYIADLTEKYKGLNVEYADLRDEDYENLKAYLEKLRGAESLSRSQRRDDAHKDSELNAEQTRVEFDASEAAYKEHLQRMGLFAQEFGDKVGELFGESLTETGLDLEKFSKGVTLMILDTLKKTVQAAIAQITATQIAEKGFIGVITGGLLSAAVSAAFATAQAAINSSDTKFFYEGGYTGEGNPREESNRIGKRNYVYHKDEYVVPSKVLNDPQGSELVSKLEKMRLNNPFNFNLFGKADGGFARNFSNSITSQSAKPQTIKVYADITEIKNRLNQLEIAESRGQL